MPRPEKLARSQAQEKRVAKAIGGRRQPQSGAGVFAKNDVRSERYLVECKRTNNRSQITVKLSDLAQVEREAALDGRMPVMQLEIGGVNYWLAPEWVWEQST